MGHLFDFVTFTCHQYFPLLNSGLLPVFYSFLALNYKNRSVTFWDILIKVKNRPFWESYLTFVTLTSMDNIFIIANKHQTNYWSADVGLGLNPFESFGIYLMTVCKKGSESENKYIRSEKPRNLWFWKSTSTLIFDLQTLKQNGTGHRTLTDTYLVSKLQTTWGLNVE